MKRWLWIPLVLCSLLQAQTLKTDFGVYPEPALPSMGPAGSKIVDPTFGTTILRVTDANNAPETENDVKGAIVGYSYWPTMNCNNTRLQAVVASPYSRAKIFNFDATNFQASGGTFISNTPAGLQEYSLMWSQTNPDLIYGVGQYNLYEINVATGASTTLRSFASEGHSGGWITQPTMSHDANIFAASFAGGSGSGYVCWRRSDNTILKEVTSGLNLDEVQVDKSGRYLVIVFNDGNDEVWDLSTSPATLVGTPTQSAGTGFWHRDCGSGTLFSAYGGAGLGYRNLATPNTVTPLIPGYWSYSTQQDHFSMRADNDGWALNGRYSISGGGVLNAFDNEIMQVATDGSNRVRRICHHRSVYNDYYDATFVNASKDGQFICFSSNWGNASGRHDLYIAKIPPAPGTTAAIYNRPAPMLKNRLAANDWQTLKIRDFRGRLVGTIVVTNVGLQTAKWNTRGIGSGIYFVENRPHLIAQ